MRLWNRRGDAPSITVETAPSEEVDRTDLEEVLRGSFPDPERHRASARANRLVEEAREDEFDRWSGSYHDHHRSRYDDSRYDDPFYEDSADAHYCTVEDWHDCPVWKVYLDGGMLPWVIRLGRAIRDFEQHRKQLGLPVEMDVQARLIAEQVVALAAARKEQLRLATAYMQAVADTRTLGEDGTDPYRDPVVRSLANAQVRTQVLIATAIGSIESAAVAAGNAVRAKKRAEERAAAMLRRATEYGSGEGVEQIAAYAELLSQQVISLTRFAEDLELSTSNLTRRELTS